MKHFLATILPKEKVVAFANKYLNFHVTVKVSPSDTESDISIYCCDAQITTMLLATP